MSIPVRLTVAPIIDRTALGPVDDRARPRPLVVVGPASARTRDPTPANERANKLANNWAERWTDKPANRLATEMVHRLARAA